MYVCNDVINTIVCMCVCMYVICSGALPQFCRRSVTPWLGVGSRGALFECRRASSDKVCLSRNLQMQEIVEVFCFLDF